MFHLLIPCPVKILSQPLSGFVPLFQLPLAQPPVARNYLHVIPDSQAPRLMRAAAVSAVAALEHT